MNKEVIMLVVTNKYAYAIIIVNGIPIELFSLNKYYNHLKKIKKNKLSTINNKLNSLYHFWLWSLSNGTEEDEDIQLYFARYLSVLESGFQIRHVSSIDEFNEEIEYIIYESKPKQFSTIEKEKRAVESFFKYMSTFKAVDYNLEKNFLSYAKQAKYNKGSSYGLKMSKYIQEVLLDHKSILPSQDKRVKGDIKAFPFILFDELLELANSREKLIYLLCGVCSARISQALNLTLYDLDYSSKNVWLIDPFSNEQLGFHGTGRRKFLTLEYNINITDDKEHNKFGFKYQIPTKEGPLIWLNENYRTLFFNTLLAYNPLPESLRKPRHPFFFVRSTGKRITKDEVHKTFKKHLKILQERHPEIAYRLNALGLHSLRHMFGNVMAMVEARLLMDKKINETYWIRPFTKNAMGHVNQSSTDIYFNRGWDLDIELGKYFQAIINNNLMQIKVPIGD